MVEGRDQLGDAPVQHGLLLATCLMREGAGKEGFSRSGWPLDDQIDRLPDPFASGELGQRPPCDAATGAAVDVLDVGTNAQLGLTQIVDVALLVTVPD